MSLPGLSVIQVIDEQTLYTRLEKEMVLRDERNSKNVESYIAKILEVFNHVAKLLKNNGKTYCDILSLQH